MSRRALKNVGVIGLGIIGQRVAESLRRRSFSVFVWNRTPRPFPNFVGSPIEIAQLCDYIQIFVSDDDALLDVMRQLKQSLKAHHIVLAHSTVAPHTMRAAAEMAHRRGAQFLDAPFTGSKEAAGKGELVYYIGGDEAAFRRARPVLEASSKQIVEIGEIGQATTVKIATNIVTATTVQAAAEALALVHHAGLDPGKLVAAFRGNAINSATLNMKLPKMIEGDFEPHFSVKHMLKDLQIASRLGRSFGLDLGATETVRESLLAEARQDRGDDDFSSLVHAFFPDGLAGESEEESMEASEHLTLALDEPRSETSEPAPAREVPANPAPPEEERTEPALAVEAAKDAVAEEQIDAETRIEDPEVERTEEEAGAVELPVTAVEQSDAPEEQARPEEHWPAPAPDENVESTSEPLMAKSDVTEIHELPMEDSERQRAEFAPELAADIVEDEIPAPEAVDLVQEAGPEEELAVTEEEVPAASAAAPAEQEKETVEKRGFFSRMFGKGTDY